MNKLINIILISMLALGVACRDKHKSEQLTNFEPAPQLLGTKTEGTKAEENPTFTNSYSDLAAAPDMGLYVVSEKLSLQPTGNTYDNVQCVNTAGKFAPAKNLYYPSEQFGVKLKAYIPYTASVANPSAMPITVKADQSTAVNVKASDFLFGSTTTVSPGVQKVPVELKHALSLLHVVVDVPAIFMDRTVKGCTAAAIMNSPTAGTVNLSPDVPVVTATASTKATITPIQIDKKGTSPTSYTFEAVVFPQAIAAGSSMFAIELEFDDALGNEVFVYQPKDALTLTSGGWHTVKLRIDDYGKLLLTSATVNPWTSTFLSGTLDNMGVANTFDISILAPDASLYTQGADYAVTSKVKGVRVTSSLGVPYTLINVTNADANSTSQLLKLTAAFGASTPVEYPFRLNTFEFFADAACTAKLFSYDVSLTMTGGGLVSVVLYSNSGVGGAWTPGGWGDGGTSNGQYDKYFIQNTYEIVYYNQSASDANPCSSATRADLYVGTTLTYTVNMGTMSPAGSYGVFSSAMTSSVAPIVVSAPASYPFTITKIVITTQAGPQTINGSWKVAGPGLVGIYVGQ